MVHFEMVKRVREFSLLKYNKKFSLEDLAVRFYSKFINFVEAVGILIETYKTCIPSPEILQTVVCLQYFHFLFTVGSIKMCNLMQINFADYQLYYLRNF